MEPGSEFKKYYISKMMEAIMKNFMKNAMILSLVAVGIFGSANAADRILRLKSGANTDLSRADLAKAHAHRNVRNKPKDVRDQAKASLADVMEAEAAAEAARDMDPQNILRDKIKNKILANRLAKRLLGTAEGLSDEEAEAMFHKQNTEQNIAGWLSEVIDDIVAEFEPGTAGTAASVAYSVGCASSARPGTAYSADSTPVGPSPKSRLRLSPVDLVKDSGCFLEGAGSTVVKLVPYVAKVGEAGEIEKK